MIWWNITNDVILIMDNEKYYKQRSPIIGKFLIFMENSWPAIYRNLNNFLYAFWNFATDTFSTLWRR